MSNLYAIDQRIDEVIDNADPETGEIDVEALESLQIERESFLEQIALAVKNAEAEEKMYAEEEKNLREKKAMAKNRKERTKSYLQMILNGEKIKTAKVTVSYRKSESVEVSIDPFDLPNIYTRTKVTEEADKVKIKEDLKAGKEIEGCKLVEKINMQVR